MKILAKRIVEPEDRVAINLVLTENEVKRLVAGDVVSGEAEDIFVQIVGYGEERSEKNP